MATIQLTFNLRTSPNCKTVHLLGNWDGYRSQLPLSKDSSKSGAWKGCFRFNGTLQQGQRYWYYYIIDGYSVTHDPAQPSTVEPTTQRALNILDIPGSAKPSLSVNTSAKRASRRESAHVAHGRSLSPSKIISPKPHKPHEMRRLANKRYSGRDIDALSEQLSRTQVSASSFSSDEDSEDSDIDSDACSDIPSLSSGSSSRASPASSLVSPISPASACSCDRFGKDKHGMRFRIDCGGSRCGSEASSSDEDSEGEVYRTKLVSRSGAEKRHGIAVRHSRR